MTSTFCILPWIHRFTNVGGEIQVCCTSEERDNNIRDENGRPMRAPEDLDDETIMNSRFMRELRLQMLSGQWPDLCSRCRITESAHGRSRRETENHRFQEEVKWAVAHTMPDGSIPLQVVQSDFRLGNICNLACRMCNPRSSSRWRTECSKLELGRNITPAVLEEAANNRWYESDAVLRYFETQIPTLRAAHFGGGEPLISRKMVDFLKSCIASGDARHIELSYNTNLTVIPEELKTLWPQFAGVRLYCSIDAFGALNDLIRHPSSWTDIDSNLKLIDRDHDALGVTEALVMCTVQVYNVLRLADLYEYLGTGFSFVTQLPSLIDLHYPPHFQTTLLPEELKIEAEKRAEKIRSRALRRIAEGIIPKRHSKLLETLSGAMNFMRRSDNQAAIPDFRRANSAYDSHRNESIYRIVPELNFLKF